MTCPTPTIEAVFAGTATPAAAHRLYVHLDACADCRARYERHLLFESLLPPDLRTSPEHRLRATLPRPARWGRVVAVIAAIAAAACLLFVMRADDGFHARGATSQAPAFEVYRLVPGGAPERAPTVIGRSDELAFAYTNPDGRPFLAVFAVDDTGRVYWYYPAWTNAAETPSSIAIRKSSELIELGEGIRHDFVGHEATLYAVWSDAPLTTTTVESRLRERPRADLGWPGTVTRSRRLELR